ncbi:hypothetical protein [Caulobacter sp. DWR2-3-1b2]
MRNTMIVLMERPFAA